MEPYQGYIDRFGWLRAFKSNCFPHWIPHKFPAVISGISTKQESTSIHYLGDIIHSTINLIGTVS